MANIRRASVPAVLGFLLAASFGLAVSTADAATLEAGEVRLATSPGPGASLLIPVTYRLEHSGRIAAGKVIVRGPHGASVKRQWRDRLHSGALRSPDRRRGFGFVHAVPIGAGLARALARHGASFGANSVIATPGPRPSGRPHRAASRQVGVKRAQESMCSTVPMALHRAGGDPLRLPAPRCGARLAWSVSERSSLGSIEMRGPWLSSRPGARRSGAGSVVLVGRRGERVVARQTVQVRVRPAGAGAPSVVAIGDSVTAGFGYYGKSGREMPITELLDCRPGGTSFNDACSSNSANTSNRGSALNFLPDYGLSRNIAWPAQWANRYAITDYRNYAVSGSAPADWLPGGQLAHLTEGVKAEDPDYLVMTMGANPLLSDMLFGIDNMGCAVEADLFGDYKECVERAFASVELSQRLNRLYSELVEATDSRIILMQYHLSIPSSALAYSAEQIEMMGRLLNQVIAEQAADVSAERIRVVSPPRFSVGIDMEPLYPSTYSCSWFDFEVDGRSVQSTPTQDELLADHPLSFCSGPATGQPWVISGDTGIHPSVVGHGRMASRLPSP